MTTESRKRILPVRRDSDLPARDDRDKARVRRAVAREVTARSDPVRLLRAFVTQLERNWALSAALILVAIIILSAL